MRFVALLLLPACLDSGLAILDDTSSPLAPEVVITSPGTGSVFDEGATVAFVAEVTDDGPVQGLTVEWWSDLDGRFAQTAVDGTGVASVLYAGLGDGSHGVRAELTDATDQVGRDEVTVLIVPGDTDTDTDSDTDTDTDTDTDSDTDTTYAGCTLPAVYTRVSHTQGAVDFTDVVYAPDGSYALILGYPASLYRYDAGTGEVTHLSAVSGDYWWTVAFSADGTYALVGGGDAFSGPTPVLYAYTEAGGLAEITDIVGTTVGKLPSPSRVRALDVRPGTDTVAVLSDNAASWPSQIAYMNQVTPDLGGGAHVWSYHGGASSDQGASSVSWGRDQGRDVALAVDDYLELFYFDPALAVGSQFTPQATPNTGNLRRVKFRPDGQVAWVLNWSGNGKVYTWEGVLRNDAQNSYAFGPYYRYWFDTSPDGHWKVFVGSNGTVYFSDSGWRPVEAAKFYTQHVVAWDQPPYNGDNNDYLTGVAWRPGTCEGLLVGDATDAAGMIIGFALN